MPVFGLADVALVCHDKENMEMKLALQQRLYKITTDGLYFYTGHLENGNQVLMGCADTRTSDGRV